MTTLIDKTKAYELVKRYAEESPDRQVACVYVLDGMPRCIIGMILVDALGYDLSQLEKCAIRFSLVSLSDYLFTQREKFTAAFETGEYKFTDEAVALLDAAQSIQDDRQSDADRALNVTSPWGAYRATWGDALRYVDDYAFQVGI
jgi:hypothetical protein